MRHKRPERETDERSAKTRGKGQQLERSPSRTRSRPVASLHRTVGNQELQRLHQEGHLQAKLTVSQPNDEYEREAERVAEQVTRPSGARPATDDREGGEVSRTASSRGSTVDGEAGERIESLEGGGKPLSSSTRSFFEPRFGRDFGEVCVHADAEADRAARSIDAEAFTYGTDMVFRRGAYDPGSKDGKRLLAHELTHVVQQGGGERVGLGTDDVQRSATSEGLQESVTEGGAPSVQRQAASMTDTGGTGTTGDEREGIASEPHRTFEFRGTTYHVPESNWDPFVAEQLDSLRTNVVPKLRSRAVGARALFDQFKEQNEKQWFVSGVVETVAWADMPPESLIVSAENAAEDVEEAASGTGQRGLMNTVNVIKRAEPIVNEAASTMEQYQKEMISAGQFSLSTLEVTKFASFAACTVVASATLTPAGATALQQGAVLATTSASSAFVKKYSEETGEVAAGVDDFDMDEVLSSASTAGVAGLLGGSAGAKLVSGFAAPVASRLSSKLGREVSEEAVKQLLNGPAKRMFRDTLKMAWNGELSQEGVEEMMTKECYRLVVQGAVRLST